MNYEQKNNSNTSLEVLEELFNTNWLYRSHVARSPNTPQETLKLLATDEESYVRVWVANNPNTSIETLQLLATDKSPQVRGHVAKNPNRNELIERLVFMTNYKQQTAHQCH
jgi:hypothetical protein